MAMGITQTIIWQVTESMAWRWARGVLRRMTSRPAFYPNRDDLDRESPLGDKLAKSAEIYAMWLTGTKAIEEARAVTKVKRLLLPDPRSKSLAYFEYATKKEKGSLGRDIRRTSRRAIGMRIEVRWVSEFLGYSLMIGDPNGPKAWAQIEIALPVIHGSDHPSFEFRRWKHAETIDGLVKMFEELWHNDTLSRKPTDSELEDG